MSWRLRLMTLVLVCGVPTLGLAQPASLLPTVQRVRASYPTPMSPSQLGDLLNRVAWEHRQEGWGLLKKTGGSRCPAPGGVEISCDILIHAPSVRHYDVLSDAEGAATPIFNDVGPCVLGPSSGCEMSRFVLPVRPADAPPDDPGTGGDLATIRAQLAEHAQALSSQREALLGLSEATKILAQTLQKVDTDHRSEIEALKALMPKGCEARFLGMFPGTCRLTR